MGWDKKWQKLDEIGQGGQGIVSVVQNIKGKSVKAVIKTLHHRWKNDPQSIQRLHDEYETLKKLNNIKTNVPKVIDCSVNYSECSEPFVLMEYVKGKRFDHWLIDNAPIDISTSLKIITPIIQTIKTCHSINVIHRDIKPANIIFKDNDISKPVILDFGISFTENYTIQVTRDEEKFWNEFIMLPELYDLEGNHRDPRSDITAIVGLLYALVTNLAPKVLLDSTGQSPISRTNILEKNTSITTNQLETLKGIFNKGFRHKPADRFQSIEELETELEKFNNEHKSIFNIEKEFSELNNFIEMQDRSVQLAKLKPIFNNQIPKLVSSLVQQCSFMKRKNWKVGNVNISTGQYKAVKLPDGDVLNDNFQGIIISRDSYSKRFVLTFCGIAEEMNTTYFLGAYPTKNNIPSELVNWKKSITCYNSEEISKEQFNKIVEDSIQAIAYQISLVKYE